MNSTSTIIFAFTIVLSPFAALMAYIITYDEYQHHLESKEAKKQAFRMAMFTLLIFIGVGLVSGFAYLLMNSG